MELKKHKYNNDVAVSFLHTLYIPNKQGSKIKVLWFNIVNPNNIYAIERETIFIKDQDLPNWLPYESID